MARVLIGAAGTALLGTIVAVLVSLTALGGWKSAEALPPVTLGGNCVFSQVGSTLTLTANCSPTSTLVIPANKILNGNSKTINGTVNLGYGATVIRNAVGSTTNQVLNARILMPAYGTGIAFNGPGGNIQGNTITTASVYNDWCASGLAIFVHGGVVKIQGNVIHNIACGYGVVSESTSSTITGNTFNGLGSDSDSSGVFAEGAGVTVQNNIGKDLTSGVWLVNSPTSSVKGNTLTNQFFGIVIEGSDSGAGGPVTISTNTVTATAVGIGLFVCNGGTIYQANVTKNNVTKLMVDNDFGPGMHWMQHAVGIGVDWCGPNGPATIQGANVTWNTLKDWTAGFDSVPIDLAGAPFSSVNHNTIIN